MAELPCPKCDGWMRIEASRWRCPKCGHESGDVEESLPQEATPAEAAVRQGVATSSPGREPLHGRPRSFWGGVGLGVITLTLYFWYWQWNVFAEVHRQEGTRSRGWAVALSFGLTSLGSILGHFAQRDGGPAGLALASTVVGAAASLILTVYLVRETRGLDALLLAQGSPPTGAVAWLVAFNLGGAALAPFLDETAPNPGLFVAFLAIAGLGLVAYSSLQSGLNRYWKAKRLHAPAAAPTGLSATAS